MVPNFETSTVTTKTEFNHFQLTNKVAGLGGGSLGKMPPKRLWRPLKWCPFAINAPLFGAHGTRNRDRKYPKTNNVFRLVKRQDLRAELYPTSYRIA